jgi:hypothetical protein
MIRRWINTSLSALLFLSLSALPFARVAAQTAPEGNAHPEAHAVSEEGASLPSPFGAGPNPSPFDTARKLDFASKVDLSPLEGARRLCTTGA